MTILTDEVELYDPQPGAVAASGAFTPAADTGRIIIGSEQYPATDAGFAAAFAAAKESLYPIVVVPQSGGIMLTEPLPLFNGLTMVGMPLGDGATRLTSRVTIRNETTHMFVPPEGAKGTLENIGIAGIEFQGSVIQQATGFIAPQAIDGSQWTINDLRVTGCGFNFFRNILKGSFTRPVFRDNFVNNTSAAPLDLHGSDGYVEKNFIQVAFPGNPADVVAYSEAKEYLATQFVEFEARVFRAASAVPLATPPPKEASSNAFWTLLPEAAPVFLVRWGMADSVLAENYFTPCPGLAVGLIANYAGSLIADNRFNGFTRFVVTRTGSLYGGCDGPGIYAQEVAANPAAPSPPGILVIRGNVFINCGQNGWATFTRSISLYDTVDAAVIENMFVYQTFEGAPAIVAAAAVNLGVATGVPTNITIRSNVVQHGTGTLVAGGSGAMKFIKVDNPPLFKIEAVEEKEIPIWLPTTIVKVEAGGEPTPRLPIAANCEPGQVVTIVNSGKEIAKLKAAGGTVPVANIAAKTSLQVTSDGANWQLAG